MKVLNLLLREYRDAVKEVKFDVPNNDILWGDAFLWAKSQKKAEIKNEPAHDRTTYYIPACETLAIPKKNLDIYIDRFWMDFSTFCNNSSSIWCVKI